MARRLGVGHAAPIRHAPPAIESSERVARIRPAGMTMISQQAAEFAAAPSPQRIAHHRAARSFHASPRSASHALCRRRHADAYAIDAIYDMTAAATISLIIFAFGDVAPFRRDDAASSAHAGAHIGRCRETIPLLERHRH